MSQVPRLREHKVSKLTWRMPRGSQYQGVQGTPSACCESSLIPRQLAAGYLIPDRQWIGEYGQEIEDSGRDSGSRSMK